MLVTGLKSLCYGIPLCLLLLMVGAGCERRAVVPVMPEDVKAGPEPDEESWGVHLYISEEGVPRVQIVASYMATYNAQDSAYSVLRADPDTNAARVNVFVFDEAGDTSATIRSDELFFYDNSNLYEVRGNVTVLTRENRRLESEHLFWDETSRKLRTPRFVRITTPDEQIQGYNLMADEDLSTYTLARVTGQVTVRDEE